MRTRLGFVLVVWPLLAAGILLSGYAAGSKAGGPAPSWLSREPEVRLLQLERQLRGFDLAMVETGYRYGELFFAARDGNWEAAAYHVRKLRLAIENGLERRPTRAASSAPFLAGPLAGMDEAVASHDPAYFDVAFGELTAGCNACHRAQEVAFFEVHPPELRVSPIVFGAGLRGR